MEKDMTGTGLNTSSDETAGITKMMEPLLFFLNKRLATANALLSKVI